MCLHCLADLLGVQPFQYSLRFYFCEVFHSLFFDEESSCLLLVSSGRSFHPLCRPIHQSQKCYNAEDKFSDSRMILWSGVRLGTQIMTVIQGPCQDCANALLLVLSPRGQTSLPSPSRGACSVATSRWVTLWKVTHIKEVTLKSKVLLLFVFLKVH